MNITDLPEEKLARNHFEAYDHRGPLVICYSIGDDSYLVAARPGSNLGHRLHAVVDSRHAEDKVCEYVTSLVRMFGFDDLLMRDLEVFEGEIH
jgi:PP-loop superfamily ATP-utilizing enzyme